MKNLLIFCFCILYAFVSPAQNRITTDTADIRRIGPGTIRLPIPKQPDSIGGTRAVVRDTLEFKVTLIDSLLPASAERISASSAILSAGRTGATLDVSASGGATYTVPFVLPPGINGAVPQLGLAYNSQGGNGAAGYGWNIYGLSSIARVGAAMYTDDRVGGVNLNLQDRFALDGQRLLLRSGTYGGNGAEYQTEQYSNLKIISRGVSPYGAQYGPEYFEVHHPDGSKAFYGQTAGSRSRDQYALTYMDNPQGVRFSYTYDTNGNQLYLTKVSYGSRSTDPAINEVSFSYATRSRAEQGYIGGESFYTNRRISKITVKADGNPYRHYVPSYAPVATLYYDRMTQIQELDGQEAYGFAPIEFTYDDTGNLVTTDAIVIDLLGGINSYDYTVVTADFTGTGGVDFLLCPASKDMFYFCRDLESGDPYSDWSEPIYTGAYREIFPTTWLTAADEVLPGQGMLLARENGVNKYRFAVFSYSETFGVLYEYTKYWDDPPLTDGYYSYCDDEYYEGKPREFEFVSGDFNGDGLTDIIAVNRHETIIIGDLPDIDNPSNCHKLYGPSGSIAVFIDMDRRKTSGDITVLGELRRELYAGDKLHAADFDGDGKTDILVINVGYMSVYSLNDNADTLVLRWEYISSSIQPSYGELLGDYNGDGKMDIMFPTGYNDVFVTFLSTGKGFVSQQRTQPFSRVQNTYGSGTMQQHVLIPSDVNGDGKTDMIYARTTSYDSTPNGNIYVTIHHNTGASTTSQPLFGASASTTMYTYLRHNPIPLFLNPDRANPDMEFGFVSGTTISLFKSHKNMQREALLTSTEQDAVIQDVMYGRLMSGADGYDIQLYQSGHSQIYPYIDIAYAPGFRVAKRLTRRISPSSSFAQQVFGYGNAVTNADGLGFVGFGKLVRSNWHVDMLDSNRTFTIGIQSPQLRGANLRTFTSKWDDIYPAILDMELTDPPPVGGVPDGATLQWDYITRQDVLYHTDTLSNRTFVNIPIATSAKDLLSGTYHNRQLWYDTLYNPIYLKEDINSEASKRTGTSYANSTGTPYYVGRLLSKRDTVMLATDTTTAEEQYTYTDYLPTEIKRKGHLTDFVIDSLTYDIYGNVTERKTTVPGGAQRTETMEYDPSGRFREEYVDPDGRWFSSAYNGDGTVYLEYDCFGNYTMYSYDEWQRPNWIWDDPRYMEKNIYYSRYGPEVHVEEQSSTGAETMTIYNPLSQKIEERVKAVNNATIRTMTQFDVYGRVYRKSRPVALGTSTQWMTTLNYDMYGRTNRESSFTGRVVTYGYNGLTTTVSDGVTSTVSVRDALGHTVSVQDSGGTVSYSYYANGNLKETDYGGSIQTVEQDGWGRKTKLTDPSAGVYTYSYDGWGQVTQETTPKGQTDYVYDAAGKLTDRTITGDSTDMQQSYTYDPIHKLLAGSSLVNADGNNTTYSYSYDELSQLVNAVEDNVHARFEKQYTYSEGQVYSEKTIAKEKATNYQYSISWTYGYAYGQLERITKGTGSQILWKVDALNAYGDLSRISHGANMRTDFVYDSYGYPTQRKVGRISPAMTLMTLGTTFNASRGYPTARSNSMFSWNESFGYDSMDRLTTFNDNTGSHSQQYDARGRITENTLQGTYSYLGNSYRQHELELNPTAGLYYQSRSPQQISFNAFKKPVEIHEDGHERISFQYNGALQRAHSYYGSADADPLDRPYRRHYSEDGSVEITRDMDTGESSFVFYLGGDAYSAPAIWKVIRSGSSTVGKTYYLHRDYLGSIMLITDSIGGIAERRQFDAWGNIVKLTDGSSNPLPRFVILDRGFTGHEHLFGVGLVNMNGRLYDARLHRFLSPDNFVQDPYGTQNFNRYGYALNNPLRYVDENGEFFVIDSWLIGLFSDGWKEANKRAWNDIKIWGGLFVADSNKDFAGQAGDIFSRFSAQIFQTIGGFLTAHSYNTFGIKGGVESVDYKYGATVVRTREGGWGGVTQGSFIVGDNSIRPDPNNPLFQHEYGHYLQSQEMGWGYYSRVAIPSARSDKATHDFHPVEQDANRRAFLYFNENVADFQDDTEHTNNNPLDNRGWDFGRNPLDVQRSGKPLQYVDYRDPASVLTLDALRIKAEWYDVAGWITGPAGAFSWGMYNSVLYNLIMRRKF